jgi:hypothetical protein
LALWLLRLRRRSRRLILKDLLGGRPSSAVATIVIKIQ